MGEIRRRRRQGDAGGVSEVNALPRAGDPLREGELGRTLSPLRERVRGSAAALDACAASSTRSTHPRSGPPRFVSPRSRFWSARSSPDVCSTARSRSLHLPRTDFVILSLAEICGYLLAAASFLALAGTLKAGAHIRVTMVLGFMSERMRRFAEVWAFGFAAAAAGYMTWQFANFAYVSLRFHEVSTGVVRVPLAYPQAVMALGAAILTVALIDELIIVLMRGRPSFRAAEEAITLGKEG